LSVEGGVHAQLVLGSLKSSRDLRRIYLSSVGASSSHPNLRHHPASSLLITPGSITPHFVHSLHRVFLHRDADENTLKA